MKNLSVSKKLLLGFGIVIVLSIALTVVSIIALESTTTTYQNKLNYSQQRVQVVLGIRYDTMDLRRITTAVRADSGNVDRQQAHATSSGNIVASMNEQLDRYIDLVRNDPALDPSRMDTLIQEAEAKRVLTAQYKRDLIDPNIAAGMEGDVESAAANTSAQTQNGLIAGFNSATDEMVEYEKGLAEELIESANTDAFFFRTLLIVVAAISVIASVALAVVIAKIITKPLTTLSSFMQKVSSTGNLIINPDDERELNHYMTYKDEIGQTVKYCLSFFSQVNYAAGEMEAVASGDLTHDVKLVSDSDTMGTSLRHMLENLNHMFYDINASTVQASASAKQLSEGAQSLAQGSTEQSASIQELSASIADIADKTKANADMAGRAASLAGTIMQNAEKGTRQMDEMTAAVKEINQASNSISKVIKVIDDIAFQTNILALNAAVEAARAGQHGKGFAVVAEEVRNLAAKSAEAAKDTGGLIANSMEKAELGERIANGTAASLTEIVTGINESNQLIAEIAKSSEDQSAGISHINSGIDQVAQVVQQNSATAEESAAVSQEVSNQSASLEGLIAQFKLKNGGNRSSSIAGLPSRSHAPAAPPPDNFSAGDSFGKY